MRSKLLGAITLLGAATILVVVAVGGSETQAQEGSGEGSCPPEQCFSMATPEEETEEDTLGTCTCGLTYDSDCHYESVPAFACIPKWHEDGDAATEEWESTSSTGYWGLRKYDSSSGQLELRCPIPADSGLNSIKNYSNVAQVIGYFYHYTSGYSSTMSIYTATPYGSATSLYKGGVSDSSSGQRSLIVYPTSTMYEHWFAEISVSNNSSSSFHGLRVCYDPD